MIRSSVNREFRIIRLLSRLRILPKHDLQQFAELADIDIIG